jgi:hypothetical protein
MPTAVVTEYPRRSRATYLPAGCDRTQASAATAAMITTPRYPKAITLGMSVAMAKIAPVTGRR